MRISKMDAAKKGEMFAKECRSAMRRGLAVVLAPGGDREAMDNVRRLLSRLGVGTDLSAAANGGKAVVIEGVAGSKMCFAVPKRWERLDAGLTMKNGNEWMSGAWKEERRERLEKAATTAAARFEAGWFARMAVAADWMGVAVEMRMLMNQKGIDAPVVGSGAEPKGEDGYMVYMSFPMPDGTPTPGMDETLAAAKAKGWLTDVMEISSSTDPPVADVDVAEVLARAEAEEFEEKMTVGKRGAPKKRM